MNISDHISVSLEKIFRAKNTKIFDTDPGFGTEKFGSGIIIPDPQHLLWIWSNKLFFLKILD